MRRRSTLRRPARNPIQSYKQVFMEAPASIAAGTQINHQIAEGQDNYTGPGATNKAVPTGAIITGFDIQISEANLVSIASFLWVSIQHMRSGQVPIDNQSVGGNPQRNQVHLQLQRTIGKDQNVNLHIKFKVPKKFQRVREGDIWRLCIKSDTIRTEAVQVIYKFYR